MARKGTNIFLITKIFPYSLLKIILNNALIRKFSIFLHIEMRLLKKILHFNVVMLAVSLLSMLVACGQSTMRNDVIVENENYTVTADSVVEGQWSARALSDTHIISNYPSTTYDSIASVIKLRLAINCRDNELLPFRYHYIDLENTTDTTIIKACEADTVKLHSTHNIARPRSLKLRIDLSPVETALREQGYYITATNDTIYSQDFQGVWATADVAPLNVDASQCWNHPELRVDQGVSDSGVYQVEVPLEVPMVSVAQEWKIDAPSSNAPLYSSSQTCMNALYNMSVNELEKPVAQPLHFMAAQECYTIALSYAYLQPQLSMDMLREMVNDSIISSSVNQQPYTALVNNLIWTTAAWHVYCATGDKQWLSYAFKVTSHSIASIESNLLDSKTGLYHAMCPYYPTAMNQYYPSWMTTRDAWEAMPLAANVIMEHTLRLMEDMADEFEMLSSQYAARADRLKDAINHRLWNENRGCYSQYLYGGLLNMQSPCVDNMAQAMSILWDIADDDRAETLINETPITNFGVPLLYPNQPQVGAELNNAVVPMAQAMWNLAAAKTGNLRVLRRGMGAMLRQQLLFASCANSSIASSGAPLFRCHARSNAAGNIAMILRVIAGMNYLPNGIEFQPKVPVCFTGTKTLSGLKYRNAILNITIKGTGNELSKITLDGKPLDNNFINSSLQGTHKIVITMNGENSGSGKVTVTQKMRNLPPTPQWLWNGFYGTNYNYDENLGYKILINGEPTYSMRDSVMGTRDTVTYRIYSLVAINRQGHSFIAEPHSIGTTAQCYSLTQSNPTLLSPLTLPPGHKHSFIELKSDTTWVSVKVFTEAAGYYVADIAYTNGNAPQSLLSPCDMLLINANGHNQGVVVTPSLGTGQWLTMGYSSRLPLRLLKGENTIRLRVLNVIPGTNISTRLQLSHIRIIKE